MKLLDLLTTKYFFSFILGCSQDLNFARSFWYGWVETGLNGRNCRANLMSCGHPRIKLKKCFVVKRPKSFIENCLKKLIHKTSSNEYVCQCSVAATVLILIKLGTLACALPKICQAIFLQVLWICQRTNASKYMKGGK